MVTFETVDDGAWFLHAAGWSAGEVRLLYPDGRHRRMAQRPRGAIEFEPGLQRDLPELLDRLMPPSRDYGHEQTWHDGNGHSHLQATLLGPSLSVPVTSGKLHLGTWQQIVHVECDTRPRERTIVVTVLGE
jgi:hypothetical protein